MTTYFESFLPIWAQYWYVFIIAFAGVIIILVYAYLSSRKVKPVTYSRTRIEREKFYTRMKFNKPDGEKYFSHGQKGFLGFIVAIKPEAWKKENGDEIAVHYLCIKPTPFNLRIPIPIGHVENFICASKNLIFDGANVTLNISAPLHSLTGIYYDQSIENEATKIIKNDNIIRTDYEDYAGATYASAQEMSTLRPENAHSILKSEIELEKEEAKRARVTES